MLFNQVKIIQEPFIGRQQGSFFRRFGLEKLVGILQELFIFIQARQQAVRTARAFQRMPAGQAFGEFRHLLHAEQFRPQRLLLPQLLRCFQIPGADFELDYIFYYFLGGFIHGGPQSLRAVWVFSIREYQHIEF